MYFNLRNGWRCQLHAPTILIPRENALPKQPDGNLGVTLSSTGCDEREKTPMLCRNRTQSRNVDTILAVVPCNPPPPNISAGKQP